MLPRYKIIIALLLVVLPFQKGVRAEKGPTQSWLMTSISQRLDYGLSLVLESENRFFDEGPAWHRYEIRPLLMWNYSPRYDFHLGYQNSGTFIKDDTLFEGHQLITAKPRIPPPQ